MQSKDVSPIVGIEVEYDSIYPCDTDSKLGHIVYQKTAQSRVTCNGIVYTKAPDSYEAIIDMKNGRTFREKLNLVDYSLISNWNHGELLES